MHTLIVFLPLIAASIVGLSLFFIKPSVAQLLTTICVCISAILSGFVFVDVVLKQEPITVTLMQWVSSGSLVVNWSINIDALTAVMLVVVTWVSSLVHIYSIGYMHHDHHTPRFFAYLSLFTFFMLMLVTADNFLQVFFGWEGVGLCSYLLIGFWFKKPSANAAAIKAFLVNRVGDFGFALGIFLIFQVFGSLQFSEVFSAVKNYADHNIEIFGHQVHALTVICILLFIGCMGKSAQLGLHTWLPDAMEGPTPVSALIHAATMVTAGVFLVARCSPLFEYSPVALSIVTLIGASTAIFAATIAITQTDIKRIIAYSTCSQLGYMFFACGVSAYSAGIFHLMTHAFFKALLFLGAGSVIHAMSDEQDIRKMGGIWKKIPVTYAMFWIGSLALAGIPPFAGFYSKDVILESAYVSHGQFGILAFWLGITAAFLTAFYSWRLVLLTFHGQPRASHEVMEHIHESPKVMLIPLLLLAIGAVFSGYVGYKIFGMVDHDAKFWLNAIFVKLENNPLEHIHHVATWVKLAPLLAGIGGIVLAYLFYIYATSIPDLLANLLRPLYNFSLNKWYIDELYDFLFVRPAKKLGTLLWKFFDVVIIDGLGPNGAAYIAARFASRLSAIQTGFVYHYAFAIIVGLVGLMTWIIYRAAF